MKAQERNIVQFEDVHDLAELLKELNDDEKAQIKAVIIGMMLARGMQDKKNTTNCTEQTA